MGKMPLKEKYERKIAELDKCIVWIDSDKKALYKGKDELIAEIDEIEDVLSAMRGLDPCNLSDPAIGELNKERIELETELKLKKDRVEEMDNLLESLIIDEEAKEAKIECYQALYGAIVANTSL